MLLVSDPKALQYIFHASGYQFAKSVDTNRLIEAIFGRGLVTAVGAFLDSLFFISSKTCPPKTRITNDSVKS